MMKLQSKLFQSVHDDPSGLKPLIAEQKKRVARDARNPEQWIRLGILFEQRLECIRRLARESRLVRYSTLYLFLLLIVLLTTYGSVAWITRHPIPPFTFTLMASMLALAVVYIVCLRHPRSGVRCFKKALALDPDNGDAYLYLGLIALRRYRKKAGYRYLERAVEQGADDKKIKQELKTLYQKEFYTFFKRDKQIDEKSQAACESLEQQLEKMASRQTILQTNNSILTAKLKQVKSVAAKNTKSRIKELTDQFNREKEGYRKKIEHLEQKLQQLSSQDTQAPVVYVNMGDELIQNDIKLADLTFWNSMEQTGFLLELDLWKSLSKRTRFYLITAEQTYLFLSKSHETADFSLIGLEWCKALEFEINTRFIGPFIDYLGDRAAEFLRVNTTGNKKGKPKYFSYLPLVVDQYHYPAITTVTLGQFDFLLKHCLRGEFSLQEYTAFLSQLFDPISKDLLAVFQQTFSMVTRNYRNVIAHGSFLDEQQCNQLRTLLFIDEMSLFRIITSIPKSTLSEPTTTAAEATADLL